MRSCMVTEYEGTYGGFDQRKSQAYIKALEEQRAKQTVLRPAYAVPPTAGLGTNSSQPRSKFHLLRSEINPGFVARTEAMSAFTDPTKPPGAAAAAAAAAGTAVKDTANVKSDAKASATPQAPTASAASAAGAPPATPGVDGTSVSDTKAPKAAALKPPPRARTHEEMLINASQRNLKWWQRSGHRLWSRLNPVTQNKRFAPFANLQLTPETEYQRAFQAAATSTIQGGASVGGVMQSCPFATVST